MDGETVLRHIESVEIRNGKWLAYVMHRSNEVLGWIIRLRTFAARQPETRVAILVTAKADRLQSRLNAVLAQDATG